MYPSARRASLRQVAPSRWRGAPRVQSDATLSPLGMPRPASAVASAALSTSASRLVLLQSSALSPSPPWRRQPRLLSSPAASHRCSCSCWRRSYHATPRAEIVPLIGAAALLAVAGRYGYRALRRMDEEWEEYQHELQRYEKVLARTGRAPGAVVAVDFGSMFTKIAINRDVVVSREGDRSVFNGVIYDDDGNSSGGEGSGGGTPVLRSRSALERFFYEKGGDPCPVRLPWVEAGGPCLAGTVNPEEGGGGGGSTTRRRHPNAVSDSVSPALAGTLDRVNETLTRMVATVPAPPGGGDGGGGATFHDDFSQALERVGAHHCQGGSSSGVVLVPDPVAAVWGAQAKGILPDDDDDDDDRTLDRGASSGATLVVDVGALVSQVSVVRRDVVVSSSTIPWGGEHFVQAAIQLLLDDSPGAASLRDARSLSALQVQARAAVAELSTRTRVGVHVPYLFPDPGNHHLDAALSRSVLELAVDEDIRRGLLFDDTAAAAGGGRLFSPHFPPPTDLSSLWMSCITQVLERGQMLPSSLDRVLLVGGGAKPPAVARSLQSALFGIMGGDATSKVVIPDVALQGELTVIGASTMLPSFEYNSEHGLQRIKS